MADSKHTPTPDYTAMDGPQMLAACEDNAGKWAAAFCQHVAKFGTGEIGEGWMIGWFANAIEHSNDVRRWRSSEPSRDELLDALGTAHIEMAALIMDPSSDNPEWPVMNQADHDCLTKAYRAIRDVLTRAQVKP